MKDEIYILYQEIYNNKIDSLKDLHDNKVEYNKIKIIEHDINDTIFFNILKSMHKSVVTGLLSLLVALFSIATINNIFSNVMAMEDYYTE